MAIENAQESRAIIEGVESGSRWFLLIVQGRWYTTTLVSG